MRSISPYERYSQAVPLEDAGVQFHTFVEGDTLSGIAHRYYEDWRQWKRIADHNSIPDPRQVTPGTRLSIPPLPLNRGAFESS